MDYAFYLRTERSPADIHSLIERRTQHARWRAATDPPPEPIWVTEAVRSTREMIAETYGFEPNIVVSVQLDKFAEDLQRRDEQALDVLRTLLGDDDGDLYADLMDGTPVLLRTSRRVEVDQRWLRYRPWAATLLPPADQITALAST